MPNMPELAETYVNTVTSLLNAADALVNLRKYYDNLDIGNVIIDADLTAVGVTKAQFVDAVAAAESAALVALVTPLQRLRKISRR